MDARKPVFARKGSPSLTVVIGHGKPPAAGAPDDPQEEGQDEKDEGPEPVQCPECNCVFDAGSGKVLQKGQDYSGHSPHMPMQVSGPNPSEGQ